MTFNECCWAAIGINLLLLLRDLVFGHFGWATYDVVMIAIFLACLDSDRRK